MILGAKPFFVLVRDSFVFENAITRVAATLVGPFLDDVFEALIRQFIARTFVVSCFFIKRLAKGSLLRLVKNATAVIGRIDDNMAREIRGSELCWRGAGLRNAPLLRAATHGSVDIGLQIVAFRTDWVLQFGATRATNWNLATKSSFLKLLWKK